MSRSERSRKVRKILYPLDDFTYIFFIIWLVFFLLFRAEVIIGGFVVKELSSDPPSCLVTYITRVDLKGKFPLSLMIHTSCVYSTAHVCSPLAQFFVVYMPEHFSVFLDNFGISVVQFFSCFDTFSTRKFFLKFLPSHAL